MIGGRILTASAVAAWAQGSVYMSALVTFAKRHVIPIHVPALALATGLNGVSPVRAEKVHRRLDWPIFTFSELDRDSAIDVARTATRWQDEGISPADAHVINVALSRYDGWPIVTTAGESFWARFLPKTPIERLP
ncbi:hypothetical protein ACFOVU_16580 [Nocardiopsis sediminis]|uniref:PIN domain-containing protein n=1 Tax=Nocardiopsis sediminis TaxID=1778267 RepID=A0ABV8FN61_9ACTN